MKILTVSGYQPIELNIFDFDDKRIYYLKKAIEKRLISFIDEGLEWVLVSGQIGVELWTAEVVLELKKTYNISLAIVPPFQNQEKNWPEPYQQQYQKLIYLADFYQSIYEDDYKGAYQFRAKNQWFIEKSDACLLLMDEEHPENMRYFLGVAKEKDHYPIYYITPFDIEDIVEEIRMMDPDYWNK